MVKNTYSHIRIAGMAAAVSSHWQSIEECAADPRAPGDFHAAKFTKSTGVKGRYLCLKNQTPADFCVAAAENLLTEKKIARNEIGGVVYVTQSPDYRSPATACVMQHRLGLSPDCVALDVNMGCSGFVCGLNVSAGLLAASSADKALLLCGDLTGQDMDRDSVSNSDYYLFGDAGAAILLEKTNDEEQLMILSATDGSGLKVISSPGCLWRHPTWKYGNAMDGVEVFNFAISRAPEMLKAYMEDAQTTPEDYDRLVLHQANLYIMKQVAKRAGFPPEKMSVSIDRFGNTSCVSIPLSIVNDYGDEKSDAPIRFLTCGFGVGLSWAAVEFVLTPDDILTLVHTDEWFEDGLEEI